MHAAQSRTTPTEKTIAAEADHGLHVPPVPTVPRPHACRCGAILKPNQQGYFPGLCGVCVAADLHARGLARGAAVEAEIPKRYAEIRLTSPALIAKAAPKAVSAARQALREGVDVLTLRGGSGAAKSLLAAALCREVLDAAKPGCSVEVLERAGKLRWISAVELGTARREARFGEGVPKLVREAKHASFLVLDEFGREVDRADLFLVLDWRHGRRLPTVITTGMTLAQLAALDDGGLARRLGEPPFALVVDLGERR